MSTVLILDIDRTLADPSHREHLLKEYCNVCGCGTSNNAGECINCGSVGFHIPAKSWLDFTDPSLLEYDTPYSDSVVFVNKARSCGAEMHFITGRCEPAREVTERWLTKWFGPIEGCDLLMRGGDSFSDQKIVHAPASVHKEQKFLDLIRRKYHFGYNFFMFFDDDIHVLNMYSKYGVVFYAPTCWSYMTAPVSMNPERLYNR